ncbi:hypothetical protein KNE206_03480 [Kitasatospora sp. NE20-6]|uniref:hypothetical protein n=1 Tax=Kitasatospora sp. NE20-6 TaxID=2859066 RepID=UPI0034DBD2F2
MRTSTSVRPRRRTRRLGAAALLAGLAVLGAAGPAGAHGDTIAFAVSTLADGHLTAVATWENDHDPVTDKVAGTLSAVAADGRSVGPWPLVAVADRPGTYTTALQLPPGHWKVTVESGFPALGRSEAELDVTAVPGTAPSGSAGPPASAGPSTAEPTAGPSAAPSAAAPSASASAADPAGQGSGLPVVLAVAAVVLAAAAGAVLVVRRRAAR